MTQPDRNEKEPRDFIHALWSDMLEYYDPWDSFELEGFWNENEAMKPVRVTHLDPVTLRPLYEEVVE